ncbi:MAG TPA: hypothetical protein DCQ98_15375 [Planctomycetaceae bacterium]|nr:hypothetical protein [Planctomycetaceae bacterium]
MNPPPQALKQTTAFLPEAESSARSRAPRFTHACGDRPLEGYTIKRGIGIGGFGEVYFALSDAGKEVALKRIQRNLDVELRGVGHCLNLRHLNLISLWDIRTDARGVGWVVMEYVPGESLREEIERFPQGMTLERVVDWFEAIVEGVRHLHDRGIVHRDLKPGNIFRDADTDVVKIGDYGLSKLIGGAKRSGHTETVGTFHYMAPEVGRGSYGKEVDLYALGVILYEMLSGSVPYDGETSQEIIMKHLTASPDLSRLPTGFIPLVESLLEKDPERRCRDAVRLREAFRDAVEKVRTPSEVVGVPATVAPMNAAAGGAAEALPRGARRPATRDVVFIVDDPLRIADGDEMIFGDVVEIVTAETIDDPADSASPNPFASRAANERRSDDSDPPGPTGPGAAPFAPADRIATPPIAGVTEKDRDERGDERRFRLTAIDRRSVVMALLSAVGLVGVLAEREALLPLVVLAAIGLGLRRLARHSDPGSEQRGAAGHRGASVRTFEPETRHRDPATIGLVAIAIALPLGLIAWGAMRLADGAPGDSTAAACWLVTFGAGTIAFGMLRRQGDSVVVRRRFAALGSGMLSVMVVALLSWGTARWLTVDFAAAVGDSTRSVFGREIFVHPVLAFVAALTSFGLGGSAGGRSERVVWERVLIAVASGWIVAALTGFPWQLWTAAMLVGPIGRLLTIETTGVDLAATRAERAAVGTERVLAG